MLCGSAAIMQTLRFDGLCLILSGLSEKEFLRARLSGGWSYVTNPAKVVLSIANHVMKNGGAFINDDVTQLEIESGEAKAINLCITGRHSTDRLVICAGVYSHLLSNHLGDPVPLEAGRGYHIVLLNLGISLSRAITYARVRSF